MGDVTPHPTQAILDGLRAFIVATVREELRASGATRAELGPREIRVAKGIDLQNLATRCGVNRTTISRIESGKIKRPAPQTLNAIARGLGVPEPDYRASVATMLNQLYSPSGIKRESA